MLFEVNERLFVATASHVFEEARQRELPLLVVAANGRYVALSGTAMGSLETNGADRLDFSVILCDARSRDALSNTARLAARQLAIEHDAGAETNLKYLVQGYPLSKVSQPRPKHRKYGGIQLATFSAPARVYRLLGVHEATHLVVAHDADSSTNLLGHRAPSLKGVSGGAVWALDPDVDNGGQARLVALAIEHHKDRKAIVAVRVGMITEFIRVNAPQLVEGLPTPRFTITPA